MITKIYHQNRVDQNLYNVHSTKFQEIIQSPFAGLDLKVILSPLPTGNNNCRYKKQFLHEKEPNVVNSF